MVYLVYNIRYPGIKLVPTQLLFHVSMFHVFRFLYERILYFFFFFDSKSVLTTNNRQSGETTHVIGVGGETCVALSLGANTNSKNSTR